MTADYTVEATPGQVAAYERDGFLVVAGPSDTCYLCVGSGVADGWEGEAIECAHCDGTGCVPVLTTKPCPECGGSGKRRQLSDPTTGEYGSSKLPCPTCNGEGAVPIVVEVVVPERKCGLCNGTGRWSDGLPCTACRGQRATVANRYHNIDGTGTIPARTLLRGTAEAVPVVDDPDDVPGEPPVLSLTPMGRAIFWPEGESGPDGVITVTHHFADVPRPEVGDTAWIIRGEGS